MAGAGGSTAWERLDYVKGVDKEILCKAIELKAEEEPAWMEELQCYPSFELFDSEKLTELLQDAVGENGWHVETFNMLQVEEWEVLVKGNSGEPLHIPSLRNVMKEHLVDFIMAMEEVYGVSISVQ